MKKTFEFAWRHGGDWYKSPTKPSLLLCRTRLWDRYPDAIGKTTIWITAANHIFDGAHRVIPRKHRVPAYPDGLLVYRDGSDVQVAGMVIEAAIQISGGYEKPLWIKVEVPA